MPACSASFTIPFIKIRRIQTWTSAIGVLESENTEVDSGFGLHGPKRFNGNDGLLSATTAITSEEVILFAAASEIVTVGLLLETGQLALSTKEALPLLSAAITGGDLAVDTDDSRPALLTEKRQLLWEALLTDGPVPLPISLPVEMPSTIITLVLPTKAPNMTVPSSGVGYITCIEYCEDGDGLPSFPCLKTCLVGCQKEAESARMEKRRAIPKLSIPSFRPAIPTITSPGAKVPRTISRIPSPPASGLSGCQSCAMNSAGKNGDTPGFLLRIERCIPVFEAATGASAAVPTSAIVAML